MSQRWLPGLLWLLTACGGVEPAADLIPEPARVERGPQGGVHVLLKLVCVGCPDEVTLDYGLVTSEDEPLTFPAEREIRLSDRDGLATSGPLLALFRSTEPREPAPDVRVWGELRWDSGPPLRIEGPVDLTWPK